MNRRTVPHLLPTLLVAGGLLPAALAAASTPPADPPLPPPVPAPGASATISVDEVRPGQTGYGLSVFSGGRVERFDVEVVGVWKNMTPDSTYILARLTGQGLEKSGVIAGMSGSPVYLDGRLAGAVAFSWPFTHEALGGITPIDSMRRLNGLVPPARPLAASPAGPPVGLSDIVSGRLSARLLERELGRLRPQLSMGGVSGLQWSAAGFGELSQGFLRQALGNLAPAGMLAPAATLMTSAAAPALSGGAAAAAPSGGAALVPGGSVTAVLVDGDLRLGANGTVTDVDGEYVLAFGHPFLGLGPISVPMAAAEVVTVVSNQYSSFKIANLGAPVGAFEQDRAAGIQGRLGAVAPMIPLTVKVTGEHPRTFRMRLADVPQFTPLLVATSALGGIEAAAYLAGRQGLDMTARFRLSGGRQLEVRQSFAGEGAAIQSATHLLAVSAYLLQNPLERVAMESIEVELGHQIEPRSARLVGAHAERTVVRPGERLALNVELVPYRGTPFRRSFQLKLPEDLPAGRYSLLVGDGTSVDAARFAIEPVEPVTFAQALELLGSLHSRREIVALGVFGGFGGQGLAIAGEVLPRLPGSVRSLWAGTPTGGAVPLRLAVAQQHHESMEMPVEGLVRVDLEVRRREPMSATPAAPEADADALEGGASETITVTPDGEPPAAALATGGSR